mgnify:CR=1 FL=1
MSHAHNGLLLPLVPLRVKDVVNEDFFHDRDSVEKACASVLSDYTYSLINTCLLNAFSLFNVATAKKKVKNICKHLSKCKGTKTLKDFLWHEFPLVEEFSSTKYWRREITEEIPVGYFYNAFQILDNINCRPRLKEKLLRIRHNFFGTNRWVSKIDKNVIDSCNFCEKAKIEINKCSTGDLITMLYSCRVVQLFINNLFSTPPFSDINLGKRMIDRLLYNASKQKEIFINILQILINAYIADCSLKKTLPTIIGCSSMLLFNFKPMLIRKTNKIPFEDIDAFVLHLEALIRANTVDIDD